MHSIGPMRIPKSFALRVEDGSLAAISDDSIQNAIPILGTIRIDFVLELDRIIKWGHATSTSVPSEHDTTFGMLRQSECPLPIDLPVLDLERSFFIASSRHDGTDTDVPPFSDTRL